MKSGKHIRALRKKTGFNQREFGDTIGTSSSYISQLERDKIDISLSHFLKWCAVFKIDPEEVLKESKTQLTGKRLIKK